MIVSELMTRKLIAVAPEDSAEELVMKGNRLVGIVSDRDIMTAPRPDDPHLPCAARRKQEERKTRVWASRLAKTAAEDLLDWLENHGHSDCRLSHVSGEGFVVEDQWAN
jgi:hypothetical protein